MNNNCICGKLSATDCIFNTCKKCCKSQLCIRHNPSSKINYTKNQCYVCLKLDTDINLNNVLYKSIFVYYCDNCYVSNKNIFDNMAKTNVKIYETSKTTEPIETTEPTGLTEIAENEINTINVMNEQNKHKLIEVNNTKAIKYTIILDDKIEKNYIYEVDDISSCPCAQIPAQNCLLKLCKSCCIAKQCERHTNIKPSDYNNDFCCMVCARTNLNCKYDKFFNKKINKIVSYCQFCYKNNTPIFNNIINNSNIDKSKLKAIRAINLIVDKIDDRVLTWDIINDKFKKIKNFHLAHVSDDYTYLCPVCGNLEQFDEVLSCDTCSKVMCGNCIIFRERYSDIDTFCSDCVDIYGKIYNKYKGTVLTSEILQNNDICPFYEFDLSVFDEDGYYLDYKCPICLAVNDFKIENYEKCHKCNTFICNDCQISRLNDCFGDCYDENCTDEEYISYCFTCIEQYNISASSDDDNNYINNDNDDIDNDENDVDNNEHRKIIIARKRCSSPCELATEDNECNICYIHKKKYACVPCGHLCMCGECANKIEDNCPICNTSITTIIKIFT